jgi:dolichol-phosphate mannosyltransferase
LLRNGDTVVALTRPGAEDWRLRGIDTEVVAVDLRNIEAVRAVISRVRPDRIFHLAAHGAYSWQRDAHEMIAVNIGATVNLIEAMADVGHGVLLHAGSSSEYGFKEEAPSEQASLRPNSSYAVTKAAATHFCALSTMPAATLRLYSAYGPWEDERRLVPQLVGHALRGMLPPLVSPDVARDFVFVDDVCDAFVRAAERLEEGHRFDALNIGSGVQVSIGEIVAIARELWSVEEEPVWGSMAERDWDTTVWRSDPRAAEEQLGWRAQTSLRDGLERTGAWMREQVTA